jgi:hypothetical protein
MTGFGDAPKTDPLASCEGKADKAAGDVMMRAAEFTDGKPDPKRKAPPDIEPSPALCATDAGATETSEANGFMED